jgi:hypothetical protein
MARGMPMMAARVSMLIDWSDSLEKKQKKQHWSVNHIIMNIIKSYKSTIIG